MCLSGWHVRGLPDRCRRTERKLLTVLSPQQQAALIGWNAGRVYGCQLQVPWGIQSGPTITKRQSTSTRWAGKRFSWELQTLHWGPCKMSYILPGLGSLPPYLAKVQGEMIQQQQVKIIPRRKTGRRFRQYLLIWFLSTLLDMDSRRTNV